MTYCLNELHLTEQDTKATVFGEAGRYRENSFPDHTPFDVLVPELKVKACRKTWEESCANFSTYPDIGARLQADSEHRERSHRRLRTKGARRITVFCSLP